MVQNSTFLSGCGVFLLALHQFTSPFLRLIEEDPRLNYHDYTTLSALMWSSFERQRTNMLSINS